MVWSFYNWTRLTQFEKQKVVYKLVRIANKTTTLTNAVHKNVPAAAPPMLTSKMLMFFLMLMMKEIDFNDANDVYILRKLYYIIQPCTSFFHVGTFVIMPCDFFPATQSPRRLHCNIWQLIYSDAIIFRLCCLIW